MRLKATAEDETYSSVFLFAGDRHASDAPTYILHTTPRYEGGARRTQPNGKSAVRATADTVPQINP